MKKAKNKQKFAKGLSKQVIINISKMKNEPNWMLQKRLQAYEIFCKLKNPKWGPNLDHINFNDYIYYATETNKTASKWEDVPNKIKKTFKKLKIAEAEAKFLSGVNNQFDSEVVYNKIQDELNKRKME